MIVGAEQIAVGEHEGDSGDLHRHRVGQHLPAGARGEGLAYEKIAVAGEKVERGPACTGGGAGVDERLHHRVRPVVADPVFEDVAQEEDGFFGRALREPFAEGVQARRIAVDVEVQVGDESGARQAQARRFERRQRHHRITSACSITTGSSGTSRYGPTAPVFTDLMASTTSMPCTTLPKTQ